MALVTRVAKVADLDPRGGDSEEARAVDLEVHDQSQTQGQKPAQKRAVE